MPFQINTGEGRQRPYRRYGGKTNFEHFKALFKHMWQPDPSYKGHPTRRRKDRRTLRRELRADYAPANQSVGKSARRVATGALAAQMRHDI